MRQLLLAVICGTICIGAQCKELMRGSARGIEDAPPGSVVGQCARDGTWLIIDTCGNCKAACNFKMEGGGFSCNPCGQAYGRVTCYKCGTVTHVSGGRFKMKAKAE